MSSVPHQQNPFGVLRDPPFRLLFAGNTLAMLAFGMMTVVQGGLAFELTQQNRAVGLVYLGQGIAMVLLSPIGGALSDRISKKKLLTTAQFTIGGMFCLTAIMVVTGWITIALLTTFTLILGAAYAVMGPARQAWISDLLTGQARAHGFALQQLMMNTTRIVGPLIAGLFLALPAAYAGAYFTMALLFVGVVICLVLMPPTPPRPGSGTGSVRADLAQGGRYIRDTPDVRLIALLFGGVVLTGFPYQTLMPGYLGNTLGHPSSHLGLIFGAAALGGIVTTVALAARTLTNPSLVMVGCGGVLALSLALFAVAPSFETALLVGVLAGASSSGFQMLNNVSLMQAADAEYFGRVSGITMMGMGAHAVVAYPVGLIADMAGERATFAILACCCGIVVMLGFFALRRLPTARRPLPTRAVTGIGHREARPGMDDATN